MIPADVLLDVFIDANILLVVAFALWNGSRLALRLIGLKQAFSTELKLLNGVFLAIVCSPLAILAVTLLQSWGVGAGIKFNLSDIVVSHYLNGGFEMKAADVERLLLVRDTFTNDVVHAGGLLARLVIAAFLTGLLVGLVRLVFSVLCLRRILSQSYAWRRFGRVRIHLSDRTTVPFSTRGFRYYYVVIPSAMLGDKTDLSVSLAHEFQHLRQGDIEWEIVLEALKPFFFLNPAFHAWKRKVEDLRELNCDLQVLRRGHIGLREYCGTLLSVCQQTLRRDRIFAVAVPKVTLATADRSALRNGKMSFLEMRVLSLLDARGPRYPRLLYALFVLPMVAAILWTALAIQRPGDWSHDRLMLSTVVNLERLEEINRLSAFGRVRY